MERELWPLLYQALRDAAAAFRQKYVQYQPWAVAAVLLWAALHDRPVNWACNPKHWTTTRRRPARLPSQSTLSRRTRRAAFGLFLNWLTAWFRGAGLPGLALSLDGKPLLVGGNSHDPDARYGRAAGHLGKGYKLHALWGMRPLPEVWDVTPLCAHAVNVAEPMVARLRGSGYLLADGNYDANRLFDTAAAQGYQLITAQRDKNPGTGHHYQSPARRRCIDLLRRPFGRGVLARRVAIEQAFGNATSFGAGWFPCQRGCGGAGAWTTGSGPSWSSTRPASCENKDFRHDCIMLNALG